MNITELLDSISTLSSELKKNTDIISVELENLANAFEAFQPADHFSQSLETFTTMESGMIGISQVSEQAFLIIAQGILQMGNSFSSAEKGVFTLKDSMTELTKSISSAASDLKSLEEAMKNAGSAGGTLTETIKETDDQGKQWYETVDNFSKKGKEISDVLSSGVTAITAISTALKAGTGSVAVFGAVLGGIAVAFQAVSLVMSAFKYFDDKKKQEQEEYINGLREINAELLNHKEIMETEVNHDNVEEFAQRAEDLRMVIEVVKEAQEEYNALNDIMDNYDLQKDDYYEYYEMVYRSREIVPELTDALKELGFGFEDVNEILKDDSVYLDTVSEQLEHITNSMADYTDRVDEMVSSLINAERITDSFNSNINQQVASLDSLEKTYASLAEGEELSSQNLMQLSQQYPQIAELVSDNAVCQETLMEAIEEARKASKKATIDELKNKKTELEAESKRLEDIITGYEEEVIAHSNKTEDEKKDLKDFHDYAIDIMESLNGEGDLPDIVPGAVGEEGKRATYEAARARLNQYTEDIASLDAQIDLLEQMPDTIEIQPKIELKSPKITYSGGSSVKSVVKKELEEEISEYQKHWNEYEKLTENKEFESLESKKAWLDEHLEAVEKSNAERIQYDKEYNSIVQGITEEAMAEMKRILDANEGNADASILALEDLIETYAEFGDVVETVQKKITEISDIEKAKREKILKEEADGRRKQTDQIISATEERHRVLKSYDGIRYGSGEDDVFKYTTEMEINRIQELIAAEEDYIQKVKAQQGELSEHELKLLSDSEAALKSHLDARDNLYMKHLKEQQAALETAYKEKEAVYQQEFNALEEAYKESTQMIKSQYDERIQAAKEAADKEIDILQNQINEIDKLMAKQAIDEQDDNYNRKKSQLEQLMAYETDDSNKYELQKELDRLNQEYEKRKQKEALDAQKAALQEEMNNVRDRLNQETQALEEMRDSELKTQEAQFEEKKVQFERETQLREEELKKQQAAILKNAALELEETTQTVDKKLKAYKKDTGNHKVQLDEQENNIEAFHASVYRKYEEAGENVRLLGESIVTYILEYLNSRVSDFADAGRRAGEAYADAFMSASRAASSYVGGFSFSMSSNLMNVSRLASSLASANAAPQASATSFGSSMETKNNEVTIYQTITAPVATPSMVASQTKRELQQALRYS